MKYLKIRKGGGRAPGTRERAMSVAVFSLFFSWLLAFSFEGQVLYALADRYRIEPRSMVFPAIAAHFLGLVLSGFLIRSMKSAKKLMYNSILFCLAASGVFFFPPSILWNIALISASLLAGGCVAAWGYYFKHSTPRHHRIETAADGLIYSNLLMILINVIAVRLSAHAGLALSMLMLLAALHILPMLPSETPESSKPTEKKNRIGITGPLTFLCLFIAVITINSGLMYQTLVPAYQHLEWLSSWYWALPYIAALFIMRNIPGKINRANILYTGIAMIGFAFVFYMILDRSAVSYLLVDTLMLGACGIFDLFWWSILGEMLDMGDNPARVLGIGLGANVLGVLVGGMIGSASFRSPTSVRDVSVLAFTVVFLTLSMLPILNKYLSELLKNHVYLTALAEMSPSEQKEIADGLTGFGKLTTRESEIASLLVEGKTYRAIAGELFLSENTVKTHVKNIYSKFNVRNRMELTGLMMDQVPPEPAETRLQI